MESANELVYVVDDDSRVREALSALLRANGRNVQAFSSGGEFLDTPHRNVVACLILDMRMPGMNGLEVQKLLRMDSPIPVIFITGSGRCAVRSPCHEGRSCRLPHQACR